MGVVGLWFLNLLVRVPTLTIRSIVYNRCLKLMDQTRTLATRKVLEYFLTLFKVMAQDNLGCEEHYFFAAKKEAVARQREKWKYNS